MKAHLEQKKIGFIGGGNAAHALATGLIRRGIPADHIMVSDTFPEKCAALKSELGLLTADNNQDVLRFADLLVLSVKPQSLRSAIQSLDISDIEHPPLVISVAAGIGSAQIRKWLGAEWPIVRVMPNTPAQVGAAVSGLYASTGVSETQRFQAEAFAGASGQVVWIEMEDLMDVVTAVSGSGPAYFYLMTELLEEAAVAHGLSPDQARKLTHQTALGAARMLTETTRSPAELRAEVTSKGGTTERALSILEQGRFHKNFKDAVSGAVLRGRELNSEMEKD
ncbi:MAG: pyrroline-5-carboxylate reductase [Xanthomonadales bacterium]|nr:pyrroline-5-carboxylate reductase [Xanthomonadales bacterium]